MYSEHTLKPFKRWHRVQNPPKIDCADRTGAFSQGGAISKGGYRLEGFAIVRYCISKGHVFYLLYPFVVLGRSGRPSLGPSCWGRGRTAWSESLPGIVA